MFQEAVATSRDLKIAVPSSLYFLVCEFLDMTRVSITSTHKLMTSDCQKRKRMSSNVRQSTQAPSKAGTSAGLCRFLRSSKYYVDVFQRMIDKIQQWSPKQTLKLTSLKQDTFEVRDCPTKRVAECEVWPNIGVQSDAHSFARLTLGVRRRKKKILQSDLCLNVHQSGIGQSWLKNVAGDWSVSKETVTTLSRPESRLWSRIVGIRRKTLP